MTDSTAHAPAWARPAAPDRHPLKRPVAPPLCRSHVHRPASTVRGHAGTRAAESIIYPPIPSALTITGTPITIRIAPMTSKKKPLRTIWVIGTTPDP